jgi:hypothetical protein
MICFESYLIDNLEVETSGYLYIFAENFNATRLKEQALGVFRSKRSLAFESAKEFLGPEDLAKLEKIL